MEKEYLIKKWLKNELTEAEAKTFNALEDSALYKEIVEEARQFKADQQIKAISFSEFKKQLKPKKKSLNSSWLKVASRIAAVFIISFTIYSIFNLNKVESTSTKYAQTKNITLPDNSLVNLNESSLIEYSSTKWKEKRILKLSGEAFFKVEKGKSFDVKTDQGTVSVLGTAFNVISRDSIFKVSCYEGLVKVVYKNKTTKLPVGTELTLVKGNEKKSRLFVSEPYWIKNMSVFENTSLKNVMFELEKHYGIKVNYIYNNDIYFTGAFEHGDLDNALKSITQPLKLTYMIQDNEVILSNANN